VQFKRQGLLLALLVLPLVACTMGRAPATPGVVPRDSVGEPVLTGPESAPGDDGGADRQS